MPAWYGLLARLPTPGASTTSAMRLPARRRSASLGPFSNHCGDYPERRRRPPLPSAASVVAWLVAWFTEAPVSDWLSFTVFGLERGSHFGEAVAFFLLDVPKVLLLLLGIITVVTLVVVFSPPGRGGAVLAGRGLMAGTVSPASLGSVTPREAALTVPAMS